MSIKVVSFDLDDTLLDASSFDMLFWYEEIPKLYAAKYALTLEKAKKDVIAEYKSQSTSNPDWYRPSHWFRHFGFDEEPDSVLHRLAKGIKVFPDVVPTLRALKQAGYRLAIITHSGEEFLRFKLHAIDIDDIYFSHLFSTIDAFSATKKDPRIYRDILERLAITRDEIIHIGDNEEADYVSPRKAGIRSFLLDRGGKRQGPDIVHDLHEFRRELERIEMEDVRARLPRASA